MSSKPRKEQSEAGNGTLGALLYAKTTRVRQPESEWVALVRSVASGDELALHALYQRTHRIVFTSIMRIVHDRQTAEELTLDVFHDVWRRASSYDAVGGTVVGWIMNQARSRALDRHRFERRKKRVESSSVMGLAASTVSEPGAAFEQREQVDRLREALTVLSVDERRAIEAAFFAELTHVEAAEHVGQPLGTLKTRVRSGLEKLRAALAKEVP